MLLLGKIYVTHNPLFGSASKWLSIILTTSPSCVEHTVTNNFFCSASWFVNQRMRRNKLTDAHQLNPDGINGSLLTRINQTSNRITHFIALVGQTIRNSHLCECILQIPEAFYCLENFYR